ncbi:MAG: PrsW family intramembrane metalloprotease [Saccharopolyspora rectivirgula]|uniref:PrsW family intramembrane metalloprotease n=1 Tax=Saccharopolyspora rectivirgula TaxID=28042 RepID=UPI002409CD97|nr:PrsW family intramembrane metalloprotease [Saccharopolyspora rectivirgula]
MPGLSPKSILAGRSSNRTPVLLIVGMVLSGICLLLALALYLFEGGPINVVVASLLALPTAIVLVALILLIDRLEPEPRGNLILAFSWGAGVAIFVALLLNTTTHVLLIPAVGEESAEAITSSVVAPLVEESGKGLLLLYLLLNRPQEFDGPTDGIVYAALSGLGFALVENVSYYMQGIYNGSVWFVVILRGVIAPLGHPLYTAMTGLGVAYAATHRGAGRVIAPVLGWCGAVFLHGLWNGSLTIAGFVGGLLAYGIQFLVIVAVVVVLVRDRKRIVGLIQTYLPAYIPSGLVHQNDIQMLGTMSGRRQARRWARGQAGLPGVRAMSDYQLAATELALLHAHAARRTVSPQQFHERQQAILGLMRVARDTFFRKAPQPVAPPWARHEQSGFFTLPAQLQQLPTLPQSGPQQAPQQPARPPQQQPMPQQPPRQQFPGAAPPPGQQPPQRGPQWPR